MLPLSNMLTAADIQVFALVWTFKSGVNTYTYNVVSDMTRRSGQDAVRDCKPACSSTRPLLWCPVG